MPSPTRRTAAAWLLTVLAPLAACQRSEPVAFVPSPQVEQLPAELQTLVETALREQCGTPSEPILLGAEPTPELRRRLTLGAAVYVRRCQPCHGTSGDGQGPAADYLSPRPRDYRRGIFKFTSTPYGAKPTRDDLKRTLRRGIVGSSMPSFAQLPDDELEAVIDYVLALTHRGELETLLAAEAESSEELPTDVIAELIEATLAPWHEAESQVVEPAVPMPPLGIATVAEGREAFLTKGCSKCHGADGRGATRENVGVDVWGFQTFAADLTSGMLRGGSRELDIYRRIASGINGTPMPSFRDVLSEEPETIWKLAQYVTYVSQQRRRGEFPALGSEPAGPTAAAAAAPEGEGAEPESGGAVQGAPAAAADGGAAEAGAAGGGRQGEAGETTGDVEPSPETSQP